MPLDEIDVSKPDLYQLNRAAFAYFERLRKEAPVHYRKESDYGPFWSVTKYNDIVEVDRNHKIFSADSARGGHLLGYEMFFYEDDMQYPMFIAMDPPRHNVQRKAVSPVLNTENLKKMESRIRDSCASILDSLPEGETFNWVDAVSIEFTIQTLAVLFDFPFEDRHMLTRWSDISLSLPGSGFVDSWEARKKELREMEEYFSRLWMERQDNVDGFDLISMFASSLDTQSMTTPEYMGNVILLIVGGNDTTRNSLTGSVLALNQYPDEYRKLRENPDLITGLVPEAIRWQTPVSHMKRTALEDVELGGQTIRAGDKVVMWYISGNRDEEVIERPNELVIDRPNPRNHLSFGSGLHRCVGDRLGEMQLRIAWEEILKRFETVEVVGDPVRVRSNVLIGYSALPVRVKRLR